MMTNLFSIFDPSTNMNLSLNWLTIIIALIIMPKMFWSTPSQFLIMWTKLTNLIFKEMYSILKSSKKTSNIIFMSLFCLIMTNNLISLFPYIFPPSSHLMLSFSLAFPLWLSLMIYTIKNKFKQFFISLTPMGTLMIISPFLTIVELISNLIRPLTLSIRLSTNITSGHLIMELISKMMEKKSMISKSVILIHLIILLLETMMSLIQAYVFSILSTMYLKELY